MGVKKMGWWDAYWARKNYPDIDAFYVATVEEKAKVWACSAITDADHLAEGLRVVSGYLEKSKYVSGFVEHRKTLSKYKDIVDRTTGNVSKINDACDKVASIAKIADGIGALRDIGDIRDDPEGAAAAFGKVLSGVGELADFLPPPLNWYVGLLKDAEDFFVNVRKGLQPEIHIRGENKRILDEDPVP